ncbi:hypothetical protein GCM10022405_08950 [Gibbsiella dentisursi]|uniref:Uncharacterized protein n=1 Tax=Gibbsiella dentisursi TaxID=796890 RepID=A0ABP7KR97_9GAMM
MTNKFIINDNVIFIPNENRILSKDNHRKNSTNNPSKPLPAVVAGKTSTGLTEGAL